MPSVAPDIVPLPSKRKLRQPTSSVLPSASRRKTVQVLLGFVTLVLIINALVGERGLMETLRARRQHQELVTAIERLRTENAKLRGESRRLKTDPAAIEAIARQELGLIKPGELLFIIRDAKPASTTARD
jgi:cell division protein FtsB